MVKTTKGPVAPKEPIKAAKQPLTAEDKQIERVAGLDDETWDRITSMARSQSISPAECIRRAITQVYGSPQTSTAYHSGHE